MTEHHDYRWKENETADAYTDKHLSHQPAYGFKRLQIINFFLHSQDFIYCIDTAHKESTDTIEIAFQNHQYNTNHHKSAFPFLKIALNSDKCQYKPWHIVDEHHMLMRMKQHGTCT